MLLWLIAMGQLCISCILLNGFVFVGKNGFEHIN